MRIVIVGGGIGGLCASLALGRSHEVVLCEAAPAFEPVGAGIVLAPNAVACLHGLGVDTDGLGTELAAMEVRDHRDRLLQTAQAGRHRSTLGPTIACPRHDLHARLVASLPPDVEVHLGAEVVAIETPSSGVGRVVRLRDGAAIDADLVVGADGLRSPTRTSLGLDQPLRYSGDTCWRGFAPEPGLTAAVEYWGPRCRVGLVPTGGGQVYFFLVRPAAAGSWRSVPLATLSGWYDDFPAQVRAVLASLDAVPALHHDLYELHEPVWGAAPVALLGDAAHAMTPNLGQGAAMAIEDAVALGAALTGPRAADAAALADPAGLAAAVAAYVAARHDRVRRIQRDARRLGRLTQWQGRLGRPTRDLLVRLTPDTVTQRAFDGIATGGPVTSAAR